MCVRAKTPKQLKNIQGNFCLLPAVQRGEKEKVVVINFIVAPKRGGF